MKTHLEAHSEYDVEWLESIRPPATKAQVAAQQEWEDEGGSVEPETKLPVPEPKVPL